MQDRPTSLELLGAVRDFLEEEVVPTITDRRLRYHALIAVNVLRILEREVPGEEGRLRAELDALHELLDLPRVVPPTDATALRECVVEANRELCERIRAGAVDSGPWRQLVLTHLRATVEEKLSISNPTRLGVFLSELEGH